MFAFAVELTKDYSILITTDIIPILFVNKSCPRPVASIYLNSARSLFRKQCRASVEHGRNKTFITTFTTIACLIYPTLFSLDSSAGAMTVSCLVVYHWLALLVANA